MQVESDRASAVGHSLAVSSSHLECKFWENATTVLNKSEISMLLYLKPDVVKMSSAANESGKPQKRLHIPNAYTPIWWYADYPNHYAGEGTKATKEYGKLLIDQYVDQLAKTIKAIKADKETLALQEEFYNRMLK